MESAIPYKNIVTCFIIFVYLFETYLDFRQFLKFKIKEIPKNLVPIIPKKKFIKGGKKKKNLKIKKIIIINSSKLWRKKSVWKKIFFFKNLKKKKKQ